MITIRSTKRIFRAAPLLAEFATSSLYAFVHNNNSKLAALVRRRLLGTLCYIDTAVLISERRNFSAGQASALYHASYILNTHGYFTLGNYSHLGAFCYVNACYGAVTIGDNVAIGPGTRIIAHSNNYARGTKVTEEKITDNVTIGDNVFIGANCVILPGTTVADNVVVGAGSMVKGNLKSNNIYAGTPCKIIKSGWYE